MSVKTGSLSVKEKAFKIAFDNFNIWFLHYCDPKVKEEEERLEDEKNNDKEENGYTTSKTIIKYVKDFSEIYSTRKEQNLAIINCNFAFDNLNRSIESVLKSLFDSCFTKIKPLQRINFVCPTNDMRDTVNKICYEWFAKQERALFQNVKKTDNEQIARLKPLWSKKGVFTTYEDYQLYLLKKRDIGFKKDQFSVGDLIVLTGNHSGTKKISFCPFKSDEFKKNTFDVIQVNSVVPLRNIFY